MAAEEVGECLLVGRLEGVVELVDQALADLGDHVVGIEPSEALLQEGTEQSGVAQVCLDGCTDAGVLHLDGDGALQPGRRIHHDGAMNLADARRGDRLWVPLDEHLLGWRTQLSLDDTGSQFGAHRGSVGLQLGQRDAHRLRQSLVHVAGHLAELHQRTLHVAEAFGDRFCCAQFALTIELATSLGRGEQLARRSGCVGAADLHPQRGDVEVAAAADRAPHERGCTDAHGGPCEQSFAHRDRSTTERHARIKVGTNCLALATTAS